MFFHPLLAVDEDLGAQDFSVWKENMEICLLKEQRSIYLKLLHIAFLLDQYRENK